MKCYFKAAENYAGHKAYFKKKKKKKIIFRNTFTMINLIQKHK